MLLSTQATVTGIRGFVKRVIPALTVPKMWYVQGVLGAPTRAMIPPAREKLNYSIMVLDMATVSILCLTMWRVLKSHTWAERRL
jgi:hypothetical protein